MKIIFKLRFILNDIHNLCNKSMRSKEIEKNNDVTEDNHPLSVLPMTYYYVY